MCVIYTNLTTHLPNLSHPSPIFPDYYFVQKQAFIQLLRHLNLQAHEIFLSRFCRSSLRRACTTPSPRRPAPRSTWWTLSFRTPPPWTGGRGRGTRPSTTALSRTSRRPCGCSSGQGRVRILPTTTGKRRLVLPKNAATISARSW